MAKIKWLTAANRDGVAIAQGAEMDLPEAEAQALIVNGLAKSLDPASAPAAAESAEVDDDGLSDGSLDDVEESPAPTPAKPTKAAKAKK